MPDSVPTDEASPPVSGPGDAAPVPLTGDSDAWRQFLALLAPDASRAAPAFEALRRKLVDIFRWRGLAAPNDLADEALDRAVRHVAAGEPIRSVASYVAGIANRLALEAARRQERVVRFDEKEIQRPATVEDPLAERLESLERCLERMPSHTRQLVLRYYAVGTGRIADRKRLADDLGIGLNALRIRVHRLRLTLEACMHELRAEHT